MAEPVSADWLAILFMLQILLLKTIMFVFLFIVINFQSL